RVRAGQGPAQPRVPHLRGLGAHLHRALRLLLRLPLRLLPDLGVGVLPGPVAAAHLRLSCRVPDELPGAEGHLPADRPRALLRRHPPRPLPQAPA
ncbi:unnamed protein product, partial [Heterosigma akashiwo]